MLLELVSILYQIKNNMASPTRDDVGLRVNQFITIDLGLYIKSYYNSQSIVMKLKIIFQ
jgi:hypothetical protein